ncbi:uncharacterized protein BO88DRAFT_422030 [Aspergillus vadensis CBS 113365]|uniref:Uncharacterized protein n=1 Tax=Aspergillus vadensis (strain CBS 113365 / IMI 142717 / IBT 24658) TaxID=1448311 RepID=A0A319BN10_ASPVC|nr:hypothetical protein BO88DRAFT_422030 [Aspergillus vadensis CBS 113365]PYH73724.1 hypothetical protein BO88DRAFT_422030 [Aspergillus vadensis CBS 113365]
MILPRDVYPRQDSSSSVESPSSGRDQIIIGVVFGGVAAIMIISAILLIRCKKRSNERRHRRQQQRLLAHHLSQSTTGYYQYHPDLEGSKPQTPEYPLEITSTAQQEPSSCLEQQQHPPQQRVIEDPPPAYQPLPVYDPSRYHGVDGMVGIAVPYPGVTASMYRMSGLGIEPQRRVPDRDSNAFSFAVEERLDVPVNRPGGEAEEGQSVQRPRPVLSRLVTNFGDHYTGPRAPSPSRRVDKLDGWFGPNRDDQPVIVAAASPLLLLQTLVPIEASAPINFPTSNPPVSNATSELGAARHSSSRSLSHIGRDLAHTVAAEKSIHHPEQGLPWRTINYGCGWMSPTSRSLLAAPSGRLAAGCLQVDCAAQLFSRLLSPLLPSPSTRTGSAPCSRGSPMTSHCVGIVIPLTKQRAIPLRLTETSPTGRVRPTGLPTQGDKKSAVMEGEPFCRVQDVSARLSPSVPFAGLRCSSLFALRDVP